MNRSSEIGSLEEAARHIRQITPSRLGNAEIGGSTEDEERLEAQGLDPLGPAVGSGRR